MTVDLSTSYLGLDLTSPLVAAPCPMTGTIDRLRRLEDAGAAAAVLPSLFQEQIVHSSAEVDRRLQLVAAATEQLDIPVLASLNGTTRGSWVHLAHLFQEAGAAAVELNIYFMATRIETTSTMVELQHLDLVDSVRGELSIPLSVKLSPYFNAFAHMAHLVVRAGADGLVLFNRFYQPDIDLDSATVVATPKPSVSQELTTALRWIAVIHKQVEASLAATGGVHSAADALKVIAAGGDAAMMASALLMNGPEHITSVLDGMKSWLDRHEYESIARLRGAMSHRRTPDSGGFERATYIDALTNSLDQVAPSFTPRG